MLIEFVTILLISGVFSMFGKGGGSLYAPVLVISGSASPRRSPPPLSSTS